MMKRPEYERAFGQYDKQEQTLRKRLLSLDSENKVAQDLQQKLDSIETAIENLVRLKEFSDSVCSELLHKIIVEGRDKISFYLTAGENTNPLFFKIPPLITQSLLSNLKRYKPRNRHSVRRFNLHKNIEIEIFIGV